MRLSDAAFHHYGDPAAVVDAPAAPESGAGSIPREAASPDSADATEAEGPPSFGIALETGGGAAIPGEPEDDDGAGISSVLNGVGLSPSGIIPPPGVTPGLLFCMFKSAAGATATEKLGSYIERIELDGISFISRGPSELTKRER